MKRTTKPKRISKKIHPGCEDKSCKYCFKNPTKPMNEGWASKFDKWWQDGKCLSKDQIEVDPEKVKSFIRTTIREERVKIREKIVQFAIEGGKEPQEMKGIALYVKILKYFDELEDK